MQLFRVILIFISIVSVYVFLKGDQECLNTQTIRVDCLSHHYKKQLEEFLPTTFYLENMSYNVDFAYDKTEFYYVTGLHLKSEITRDQLLLACFYLKQSDRFKHIQLEIIKTQKGYECLFYLFGHMLLSNLSISGYMRGQDRYKTAYLIDIGERFDEDKHKHSITDIQEMFYSRGYFNAVVQDHVKKDEHKNIVSVVISLLKGSKFYIDTIACEVEGLGSISAVDIERMKGKIQDLCHKKLRKKYYSADLIKRVEQKTRALLERYGFMNFDISVKKRINEKQHTVSLVFHIVLEQKKEFVFFGNHFFKRQDLLNHLLMYGKSSWHFPSSIIIDELIQLYKSKGFWDIDVSVREEKNRIFCLIKEKQRVSVSSICFTDNDHFSSHQLSRQAFRSFLRMKFFDKETLKKGIDNLIRFYKQQGFWDIKVVKEEYLPAKKKNSFIVKLTLDEGKQRKVGTYIIEGYKELENQGPFIRSKKDVPAGFDPMVILEQKQWLMRYFRNLGYHKIQVDYSLKENDNGTLNVIWNITLTEQAVKFGKVLVTGNSIIPSSYIRREISFEQADSWDKSKLEDMLKRLRELEVFESVQVYPSRDFDEDLQKPVFVKVIDADKYELRTRMGFQQVGKNLRLRRGFTWKIGGSFLIRNPLSFGDRFMFEGDFTRFYRDFSASYYFPWVFGRSVRCQYKAYDKLYYQPVYIGTQNSLYQAGQRGFLFNMTKVFPHITMSGTAGIEFMGVKEADQPDLHTIIDYDKALLDKKNGYVFIEPTFMWQKVDNLINPKKGHLSFVSCKGMFDVDTNTSFVKLLVEHSFYVPLLDPLVLAVRMRGGHVFNREFTSLIPIERFYLGGPGSLRGYERDYCPPLGLLTEPIQDTRADLPEEACDIWRYAPQGARTMLNLNTELRFSIYKGLGGVIFNDIGFLFKDSISNVLKDGSDNLLGGTGFGLRYDTPIGPLRFDIGFKWNRIFKDFEARCAYYITLGHAF